MNLLDVYLQINPYSNCLINIPSNESINKSESESKKQFNQLNKLFILTNVDAKNHIDINISFLTYINYLNINNTQYIQFYDSTNLSISSQFKINDSERDYSEINQSKTSRSEIDHNECKLVDYFSSDKKEVYYKQFLFEYRISNKDVYLLFGHFAPFRSDLIIALKDNLSVRYNLTGGSHYKYFLTLDEHKLIDIFFTLERYL